MSDLLRVFDERSQEQELRVPTFPVDCRQEKLELDSSTCTGQVVRLVDHH